MGIASSQLAKSYFPEGHDDLTAPDASLKGLIAVWSHNLHVSLKNLELVRWCGNVVGQLWLALVNLIHTILQISGFLTWLERFDERMAIPLPPAVTPRLKSGWTPGFGVPKLSNVSIFPYVVHPVDAAPEVLLRGEVPPAGYQLKEEDYSDIRYGFADRSWTAEDVQD